MRLRKNNPPPSGIPHLRRNSQLLPPPLLSKRYPLLCSRPPPHVPYPWPCLQTALYRLWRTCPPLELHPRLPRRTPIRMGISLLTGYLRIRTTLPYMPLPLRQGTRTDQRELFTIGDRMPFASKTIRDIRRKQVAQDITENGTPCFWCREPIDLTIKYPEDMSFTVDHFIPTNHGGTDDLENCVPAHALCNKKRSDNDYAKSISFNSGSLNI